MPPYMHYNWLELLEMGLFVLLTLIVLIFFVRLFVYMPVANGSNKKNITSWTMQFWKETPEFILIVLAVPLHTLWEIAQFPLYTVWHEGDWSYILYGLVHCTLGDILIMLIIFWIVSLLKHTRYWIFSPTLSSIFLYTALGLVYTIFSEIVNTRIKGTWGYTELMPIISFVEIGGMPFLQWLLIPPVLIWLVQIMRPAHNEI